MSASGRVVLVTGGAGFIGSAVVRRLIAHSDATVVNVDKLTYAANLRNVESVASHPRYRFVKADICDADAMAAVFREYAPDHVLHLAAESHVDRSIHGPRDFLRTNVDGTFVMLNAALEHWRRLSPAGREAFRFLHVST
ncbi:GDP-mannose 4,6-dehydratase, partial [Pseudorhodoplanes sp.]|uniref:GDP-mannose 4,6-dehydratase n=1 Tax=Pseudorhodoplanes sp. TaxID=1934341 RepID=UPI002CFD58DD